MPPLHTTSLEELAHFQGIPALTLLRNDFLNTITHPVWRSFAEEFLELDAPSTPYGHICAGRLDFAVAPGSGAHHAHSGGLALHVLQDLINARAMANMYRQRGIVVDHNLLYAAIILHDSLKCFTYHFDANYTLIKSEDAFIAQTEDHHTWILRELLARDADKELLFAVATMHGIDDVSVAEGVRPLGVVNHYLDIALTGMQMNASDVRIEHTIGFLADSDWSWSGRAQQRALRLASIMAPQGDVPVAYMHLYLGSRFTFEHIDTLIQRYGEADTVERLWHCIEHSPEQTNCL